MIPGLAEISTALASILAQAAPMVVAIRTSANHHIAGLWWRADTIVTADRILPAQSQYSILTARGEALAALPGGRVPALNLALLRLQTPGQPALFAQGPDPAVGALVLLVGAAADVSPTARLGIVHARPQPGLPGPLIDIAARETETGGPLFDAAGRLLGIAAPHERGIVLVPYAAIARLTDEPVGAPARIPASPGHFPQAPPPPTSSAFIPGGGRRGWLGVALQPTTVPEPLIPRAGQNSGRMVINVTHGGPADQSGLRVGDVLLALNGRSTSGAGTLREFLGADRVGTQIEVRLLRDGQVMNTFVTVAPQP
jgi:S1-C subfamily serine protease